jgi:TonB family protein
VNAADAAAAPRRPRNEEPDGHSDFAGLAARVAAEGGGKISAEVSRELALDIVLNEIVEQACRATGASGAAIALRREGEMVCRASAGDNAPQLGTRLSAKSGLTGICVRSGQVQCCDDALTDRRADGEASRQMGVRSVMVQPILGEQDVMGIIEIFSPQPAAFVEREQRTLEILAGRILRSVEERRRVQSSSPAVMPAPAAERSEVAAPYMSEDETIPAKGFDWFASMMGAIVVFVALVMGAIVGIRVGWLKGYSLGRAAEVSSAKSRAGRAQLSASGSSSSSSSSSISSPASSSPSVSALPVSSPGAGAGISTANANGSTKANLAGSGERNLAVDGRTEAAESGPIPAGGLRVYENGREIFRMQNGKAVAMKQGTSPPAEAGENVVLRRVEPKYPEQARVQHLEGPVVLDVRIGKEGAVQEATVVSGDPVLAAAAVEAVRQWSFRPRMEGGHAVEMETEITLNFKLPAR